MDDHTADRLVECAKWFRHHLPELGTPVPDAFETEREAVERMRDALLFEAHHAMQKSLPSAPDAPLGNAVDLRTDEPGLARLVRGEVVTTRGDAVVRPVDYRAGVGGGEGGNDTDASAPPPTLPRAKLAKSMEAAERATTRAHERAERSAAESFMTKEEKAEAAEERKAERAKKAEEREAAKQAKQAKKDAERKGGEGEEEGKAGEGEEEEGGGGEAPPKEGDGDDASKGKGGGEGEEEEETASASPHHEDEVEAEESIPPMGPPPPPKRKRVAEEGAEFFASPAPHDRYLTALAESGLHPSLRGAVLRGEQSEAVRVTHGPPGCGKTHALLDALQKLHESSPDVRCLVAAPTNVGAADLYTRAFARGIIGCLALAKENMPPGVPRPRAVDLRSARFVFCTVAGRSGPRLHDQRFHAVFLDEAGLCPESIVWGLLRPDVRFLWMVGDPRQLGAVTSEEGVRLGHQRSVMERLGALGLKAERLSVQRRMHPEIAAYPSSAFYDASLVTEASPPLPCPHVSPYAIIDARSGSASASGTSFENEAEAEEAVRVAVELKRHYPHTVLLTPYAAQLRRIRASRSGVEAYTVDSFQGKEADAVVLSLVRTPGGGAGFWSDPRRLAVALTRAKHAMRVVGHSGWADDDPSSPLGALVSDARARGAVVTA